MNTADTAAFHPSQASREQRQQAFRQAISHFATGVTVVTTLTDQGPAGMTASAFSSVSLDPVLLLVCVSARLPTHQALIHSRRFAVNVLAEGHEHLARRFATPSPDKFDGVRLAESCEGDVPVLADSLAYFVCTVTERFPGGDHSIFIGEVDDCAWSTKGRPLLYFRSAFTALDNPDLREAAMWPWAIG